MVSIFDGAQDQTESVVPSVKTGPRAFLPTFDPSSSIEIRQYAVTNHTRRPKRGSLVDRGCNGGIAGSDCVVIYTYPDQAVDVTGIDNHCINSLPLVDAIAKSPSNRGDVLVVMRQYALHAASTRTIHSCTQLEYYRNRVNDVSKKAEGGGQFIKTLHGYILPIDIENGLPRLKISPPSAQDREELPVVILTSEERWDPTVMDNTVTDTE